MCGRHFGTSAKFRGRKSTGLALSDATNGWGLIRRAVRVTLEHARGPKLTAMQYEIDTRRV